MLIPDTSQLHLWVLDAGTCEPLSADATDDLKSALSDVELTRYERLQISDRKESYLLGKHFVREVLSRYADIDPLQWCFAENDYGKPEIDPRVHKDIAPISFNLSHSKDMFLMVVSGGRACGVDVEFAERERRIDALMERKFSSEEAGDINALPEEKKLAYFYQLWTLKEAYIKAQGMGLHMSLQDFSLREPEAGRLVFNDVNLSADRCADWQFWTSTLESSKAGEGYAVSVAIDAAGLPVEEVLVFGFADGQGLAEGKLKAVAQSD